MNSNKNTLIGTLLISLLIMFFMYNRAKTVQQEQEENTETTTEEIVETTIDETNHSITEETIQPEEYTTTVIDSASGDTIVIDNKLAELKQHYGVFYANAEGQSQLITLENEVIKVTFDSKGAQVKAVELKEFKTYDQQPLMLIDSSQSFNIELYTNTSSYPIQTKDMYFEINQIDDKTISFRLKANENSYYEQVYSLTEDSYLVDYDVNLVNLDGIMASNVSNIKIDWEYTALQQEQNIEREKTKSTIYWKFNNDDVENLAIGQSKEEELGGTTEWVSHKQQFFNTTILSRGLFDDGEIASNIDKEDSTQIATFNTTLYLDYATSPNINYEMQYYFGPNNYKQLKNLGRELHNIVELSADFFLFKWVKYITKLVVIPIFNLLEKTGIGYGLIILILTLIIKMGLMPLTFKSYVSAAKMKLLKPELDELKEKYKDDQQKFATAQMQLYNKAGVNMFGGCLPTLLQMPFLLAMFYFFPSSIELRQESFLWATDLSTFDNVLNLPFTIPFYGSHVSLFTLLMTASSILYAKFNMQNQAQGSQPGMEMMKYMPYIFPIFLMFMFNSWPAALTYYYFLSNMISFGQQFAIKRFFIDEEKLHAQMQENKKKKPKKGGFAAKMEEIYKQQQKAQQEQKKKKK